MTKREAERQTAQENTLLGLGFTRAEAEALRHISMTLQRWFEHECNGTIQRDGENSDGKPYWYSEMTGKRLSPVPDREAGARKRLAAIIGARNKREVRPVNAGYYGVESAYFQVSAYIQSDPRGAALYIIRPGDVPEGKDVSSYYTRGVCVY